MFDVLEHLDDPDSVINLCSKKLKKNGRLILSTMNMNSIFAKMTGKYYPWIIPMHKFYFSDSSVKKFLDKNDLFLKNIIGDVRIISLEYLFLKISQKISIFKIFYNLLMKFESIKNISIKFSLFDINIYCAHKK
jgi:2-polyprenyl-3-methyl-5-hydroxy-6-metoxy-1,4-benzoquinol methylase